MAEKKPAALTWVFDGREGFDELFADAVALWLDVSCDLVALGSWNH
jgi:hypothetical protein